MLDAAMTGARFTRVVLNRKDLRQAFPRGFAARLRGQAVNAVTRRGKYLLVHLADGGHLVMHLGMTGWFRVENTNRLSSRRREPDEALERRHDHVIFVMSSGLTVTFTDPRRFGMMDLIRAGRLNAHPSIAALGPEPLSGAFDQRALAAGCANRKIALKIALLDQSIVAGIGNIYASEALHLARLSPFRRASTLTTRSGDARPGCARLVSAIKAVLRRAIKLKESERYRESRFRVYDRERQPCPTPGCRGTIARAWQAGRSTFYCPVCQQ
jgi:formamidopyrimidine-DNA glycosylase